MAADPRASARVRAAVLADVAAKATAADAARTQFEESIRAAHPHAPMSAIAEAAGLSKSRVGQIITEGRTAG